MVLSESAYRLDTAAITVEVTFIEQLVACNPFEAAIGVTVHTEAVAVRVGHIKVAIEARRPVMQRLVFRLPWLDQKWVLMARPGHAALAESFDSHQPKQSVNHRPSSIHLNGLGARDPSG